VPVVRRHYVYYRVRDADVAAARAAALALHARHGEVELLRRADRDDAAGDALATLMEVYTVRDAALADRLENAARLALAAWLVGERHVEVFETLD
jgi:hypothetical protein